MRTSTPGNRPGRSTPTPRDSLRAASLRTRLPRVAFFSLSGCGGCIESLLGRDDTLTLLGTRARVPHLPQFSTATQRGPYDLVVIEGGIARPADLEVLKAARAASPVLLALGTCAAAGGPCPRMASLAEIVKVDHVLGGCPAPVQPALTLLRTLLDRRDPLPLEQDVCDECHHRGLPCVTHDHGQSCMGPVTQAGCGALCPSVGRGCSHCAGPSTTVRSDSPSTLDPSLAPALAHLFLNTWTPRVAPAHPWAVVPS